MYAGFWRRFAAYLLDIIVINMGELTFIFVWALFEVLLDSIGFGQKIKEMILGGLGVPAFLSIPWLYCALFESSGYQATLGKMLMGIRVVNMNFSKISFARASARYWSHILSAVFCVGYVIAAFTSKKQALHDYIAQTYVINKNYKFNPLEG